MYSKELTQLLSILRPSTLAMVIAEMEADVTENGGPLAIAYLPAKNVLEVNVGDGEAIEMIADAKEELERRV